jgi:hypothetical protein
MVSSLANPPGKWCIRKCTLAIVRQHGECIAQRNFDSPSDRKGRKWKSIRSNIHDHSTESDEKLTTYLIIFSKCHVDSIHCVGRRNVLECRTPRQLKNPPASPASIWVSILYPPRLTDMLKLCRVELIHSPNPHTILRQMIVDSDHNQDRLERSSAILAPSFGKGLFTGVCRRTTAALCPYL